jgi:hypothetical protein
MKKVGFKTSFPFLIMRDFSIKGIQAMISTLWKPSLQTEPAGCAATLPKTHQLLA